MKRATTMPRRNRPIPNIGAPISLTDSAWVATMADAESPAMVERVKRARFGAPTDIRLAVTPGPARVAV